MTARCADLSLAAGESLAGTATAAERWLVLEVPGRWPRDVADLSALPETAGAAISGWLGIPGSRLQFVRRLGGTFGRLRAFAIRAETDAGEVRRIELESYEELATLDLETAGDPVDHSLVLVCGHGSRDPCCATRGTEVYRALEERLGSDELWISSHQGGHRFAANVLVLPSGLQFGRVSPGDAPFLVARALAGRIDLGRYRGRTCFPQEVQAVESAVRAKTGIDGISELRLESAAAGVVRFRAWTGKEYVATVRETAGPTVPASCGATPEPQRAFAVELV
jgi:hypothetical protein